MTLNMMCIRCTVVMNIPNACGLSAMGLLTIETYPEAAKKGKITGNTFLEVDVFHAFETKH